MIQRIQTFFLAAAAIVAGCTVLAPGMLSGPVPLELNWFRPALIGSAALAALLSLVAIFLYKNRGNQRRVVLLAQLAVLALLIVVFIGFLMTDQLSILPRDGHYFALILPLALPVFAYIDLYLARRGIDKDEKLVQSMDRLR